MGLPEGYKVKQICTFLQGMGPWVLRAENRTTLAPVIMDKLYLSQSLSPTIHWIYNQAQFSSLSQQKAGQAVSFAVSRSASLGSVSGNTLGTMPATGVPPLDTDQEAVTDMLASSLKSDLWRVITVTCMVNAGGMDF